MRLLVVMGVVTKRIRRMGVDWKRQSAEYVARYVANHHELDHMLYMAATVLFKAAFDNVVSQACD